jgi:hypothetical protein
MNDYFMPMCDARARLAASRYVIDLLMKALEKTESDAVDTKVALSLGVTELEEIANIIDKEIV